ncbi:MAG: cyclodeaminase/cyclohydrolase family protein [Firmicutes bacterium]|nr:cyclodeaminase/cyclohydrolase family protein [Bacillota bacterium]MCL2255673.1 cyclodeaminase/cyclohydrolase family protein [Bacillota bacterium]
MLIDLKVKDFIAEVASSSPAPGGGSVSALSSSLGAGLISMLANLTVGKDGYESVQDEIKKIADQSKVAADKFLKVIDEDTKAFDKYMQAIRMPKDTDEEKTVRIEAMQVAAKGATNVPLQLARDAFALIEVAKRATVIGNKNAESDGQVAVQMLRSGTLGAIYNVQINLGMIKDQDFVATVEKEIKSLEAKVSKL